MDIVSVKPSLLAESIYQLDGKPFRLTNRKYLLPIYDGDAEELLIMSGRQVEKSTTCSVLIANPTISIPHFRCLYVAPLTDQVKVFSKSRLGKLYEYSQQDYIKKNLLTRDQTNNVFEKTFSNGSENYFRHCYEMGDNIRGLSTNGVLIDEVQDIHVDAIPVISETQSHARDSGAGIKFTMYTGTPKTFANTIQQKWEKSTQKVWIVKCPHCGKYQTLGEKNLNPHALICAKCKAPLGKEAIINGFYYALNSKGTLEGYQISQLMASWMTAEDLWAKYISYSKDKFYNEVLGRSYENASKPFTLPMLMRASENNHILYTGANKEFTHTNNYMGVDWGTGGKSDTVVSIYGENVFGKAQLIYVKRFSMGDEREVDYQVSFIIHLMQAFNIKFCLADWGFGYVQMQRLTNALGKGRFAACYYSFNLKAEDRYDPVDNKWVVNRTRVISDYAMEFEKDQIVWPGGSKAEYFDWLSEHHLVENAEYRKSPNTGRSEDLYYTHPEGTQDDGLHSGVLAILAKKLYNSGKINSEIRFSGVRM